MDTLKRKGGELGKFITRNKTLRGKNYIYIKTSGLLKVTEYPKMVIFLKNVVFIYL